MPEEVSNGAPKGIRKKHKSRKTNYRKRIIQITKELKSKKQRQRRKEEKGQKLLKMEKKKHNKNGICKFVNPMKRHSNLGKEKK